MNEILKCPCCGEAPRIKYGGILGKEPVAYSHCGAEFTSPERWNQYASAMGLAKWTINIHSTSSVDMPIPDIIDKFIAAEDRVLEAFK